MLGNPKPGVFAASTAGLPETVGADSRRRGNWTARVDRAILGAAMHDTAAVTDSELPLSPLLERFRQHLEVSRGVSPAHGPGLPRGPAALRALRGDAAGHDAPGGGPRRHPRLPGDALGGLRRRSTRARRLASIRAFYRYLVRQKLLPASPAKSVKSPKLPKTLPKVLPVEEVFAILELPDVEDGARAARPGHPRGPLRRRAAHQRAVRPGSAGRGSLHAAGPGHGQGLQGATGSHPSAGGGAASGSGGSGAASCWPAPRSRRRRTRSSSTTAAGG